VKKDNQNRFVAWSDDSSSIAWIRCDNEKTVWFPTVWKKFSFCQLNHAQANTDWRKTILLPGVRKNIFSIQQLHYTHANTYWRKAVRL